ncbi:hypothetical protein, partial [Flavobacterium wongokense]|uniref:hypothetical protein n=1 Tax=Flavobacterium wongokense TaxID=2910674 RepID=UPI001F3967C9
KLNTDCGKNVMIFKMGKLILELLGKALIGVLKIVAIMYIIVYICIYVGNTYGNIYGLILFIVVSTIIVVISNKVKKKNAEDFLRNSDDYTKRK